jgi:hypothetical protein
VADVSIVLIAGKNITAVIGGAVIEQNELKVLKRLVQNAVDALLKIRRMIIVWNDNGDLG